METLGVKDLHGGGWWEGFRLDGPVTTTSDDSVLESSTN